MLQNFTLQILNVRQGYQRLHAGPEKQPGSFISRFMHIHGRSAHALQEEQRPINDCAHAIKQRPHAARAIGLTLYLTLLGQLLSPAWGQEFCLLNENHQNIHENFWQGMQVSSMIKQHTVASQM